MIRRRLRSWLLHRLADDKGPLNRRKQPKSSPINPKLSQRADHAARSAFMSKHVFIQTHVPKTGGSALFHNLAAIFGGVHSMDVRLSRSAAFSDLSKKDMDDIHLISGHFNYGMHKSIDRRPLYIAAVREPVSRAVSNYRYMQTAKSQQEHATCRDLPFEEAWAEMDQKFPSQRRNRQAHMIWGNNDIELADWDRLVARIEEDYLLIMPHDRQAEAVARLREAFGLFKAPVQEVNVSRAPDFTPSEDIATTIRAANSLDARLFEYVVETFDARLDRACAFIAENCLERMQLHTGQQVA